MPLPLRVLDPGRSVAGGETSIDGPYKPRFFERPQDDRAFVDREREQLYIVLWRNL